MVLSQRSFLGVDHLAGDDRDLGQPERAERDLAAIRWSQDPVLRQDGEASLRNSQREPAVRRDIEDPELAVRAGSGLIRPEIRPGRVGPVTGSEEDRNPGQVGPVTESGDEQLDAGPLDRPPGLVHHLAAGRGRWLGGSSRHAQEDQGESLEETVNSKASRHSHRFGISWFPGLQQE